MLIGGISVWFSETPNPESTETDSINNNSSSQQASYVNLGTDSEPYGSNGTFYNPSYRFRDITVGQNSNELFQSPGFQINNVPSSTSYCAHVQVLNIPVKLIFLTSPQITSPTVDFFTVTPNRINPGIAQYQTVNPTIQPRAGLSAGDYTAYLVAVAEYNGAPWFISGSTPIRVRITVGQPVTYGISLSPDHIFTSLDQGYLNPPEAYPAKITNIGTNATGGLIAELTGPTAGNFTMNGFSVSQRPVLSIQPSDIATIQIQPISGLAGGTHTATLTVRPDSSNSNPITPRSLNVSFTVKSYGISVNPKKVEFASQAAGYSASVVPAQTVTIRNEGNQPTGSLTVKNSNTSFTITNPSPASITNQYATSTFTVRPNTGLLGGTHFAILEVGNNTVGWERVDVIFEVTSPFLEIEIFDGPRHLEASGEYEFEAKDFGYNPAPDPYTAKIKNTGVLPTGPITVSLSNYAGFEMTGGTIANLVAGAETSFTIRPKIGLPEGKHTSIVTITSTSATVQFNVSFFVRSYGISLSTTQLKFPDTHIYSPLPTARNIVITSTGNQPTGELTAISSEPSKFDVTAITPVNIQYKNGTATFSVRPRPGLARGNHTTSITISGDPKVPSQVLTVSFFVIETEISLTVNGTLAPSGAYTFGKAIQGYSESPAAITATVKNIGNYETGDLLITLFGASPDDFNLSLRPGLSIPSIAIGESATFTVQPYRGLTGGSYSATITVTDGFVLLHSKSFDVEFEVESLGIKLSADHKFGKASTGYTRSDAAATAHKVTITNTSETAATGELTVTIYIGTSFELVGASATGELKVPSIPVGSATGEFYIQPKLGMLPGVHLVTVLVKNASGTLSARWNASFEVIFYAIELSDTSLYLRPAVALENGQSYNVNSLAGTITVFNSGTAKTGDTGPLTISLTSGQVDYFRINGATKTTDVIENINFPGSATFTIQPIPGLKKGFYSVVVTVGNSSIASKSCEVSFFVGGFGIILSQVDLYQFATGRFGTFNEQELTVFVTNIGNLATGIMSVSLVGAGAQGFSLSTRTLQSIRTTNGVDTFIVKPLDGLQPGRYTFTVRVSGDNITSQSFDVTFVVLKYGCSCGNPLHHGDYTPLYVIPCMIGLILLLWLGLRKIPEKKHILLQREQEQAEDDMVDLLLGASAVSAQKQAQQTAYAQQQMLEQQYAQQQRSTRKSRSAPSATDQFLNAAKAKVAADTSQRASVYTAAPDTAQLPSHLTEFSSEQSSQKSSKKTSQQSYPDTYSDSGYQQ